MTSPDDLIRESLRDLIPDYQGPADPYARVGATIQRRRAHRRVLVTVGSAAAAAAVAVAVPLTIGIAHGGGRTVAAPSTGLAPQAGDTGGATGGAGGAAPGQVGAGVPVAAGAVGAGQWSVQAVRLASGARRCLRADDAVFEAAALCFDDWNPGGPVSWGTVDAVRPAARASAVFGVASAIVAKVTVVLSDGSEHRVAAVPRPDDPATRFFAVVAEKPDLTVRTVTTFAADSTPIEFPTGVSGSPACRPTAQTPCARRTG